MGYIKSVKRTWRDYCKWVVDHIIISPTRIGIKFNWKF